MQSSPDDTTKKPELTKYGGYHMIVLLLPTQGSLLIKTDGSHYHSDDEYDDPYGEEFQKSGPLRIASASDIEDFVKACRCTEEDYARWKVAINDDLRLQFTDRHYTKDFFKKVEILPEPIRAPGLCKALANGSLLMATEKTDYFFGIHIGNDFTQHFKKHLKKCRDTGKCTFTVTDRAFAAQRASRCRTCFGDDVGMAICDNCIATCHKDHDTYITVQSVKPPKKNRRGKVNNKPSHTVKKILMYCDCGYKLDCQCL
jgi:hypothetical protein